MNSLNFLNFIFSNPFITLILILPNSPSLVNLSSKPAFELLIFKGDLFKFRKLTNNEVISELVFINKSKLNSSVFGFEAFLFILFLIVLNKFSSSFKESLIGPSLNCFLTAEDRGFAIFILRNSVLNPSSNSKAGCLIVLKSRTKSKFSENKLVFFFNF